MKLRKKTFWLFVFMWLMVGCSGGLDTSARSPTEEVSLEFAPDQVVIETIETQELASSQMQVIARGYLTNNCTVIEDLVIESVENIFDVSVITKPLQGVPCGNVRVPFEKVREVDIAGLKPGSYTVVSGTSSTFEIIADAALESEASDKEPEVSGSQSEMEAVEEVEEAATQVAEAASAEDQVGEGAEAQEQEEGLDSTPSTGLLTRECEEKAAFFEDVTIPPKTVVEPEEMLVKTWRVRNEGTCTWGPGYELVFADGEVMDAEIVGEFPAADPFDIVDISIQFTAPMEAGPHFSGWQFRNPEGELFGTGAGKKTFLWNTIVVNHFSAKRAAARRSEERSRQLSSPSRTFFSPETASDAPSCALRDPGFENQLLQLINSARSVQGLNSLQIQEQLTTAALVHSRDMSCNDFLDHTGSDGSNWFDRISAQGYNYSDAIENIFYSYGSVEPQEAMDWWMNSPVYRDNIFNAAVTQVGITYVYNPDTNYGYYTIVFASP